MYKFNEISRPYSDTLPNEKNSNHPRDYTVLLSNQSISHDHPPNYTYSYATKAYLTTIHALFTATFVPSAPVSAKLQLPTAVSVFA